MQKSPRSLTRWHFCWFLFCLIARILQNGSGTSPMQKSPPARPRIITSPRADYARRPRLNSWTPLLFIQLPRNRDGRWVDGWMDRWMDRWMDGSHIHPRIHPIRLTDMAQFRAWRTFASWTDTQYCKYCMCCAVLCCAVLCFIVCAALYVLHCMCCIVCAALYVLHCMYCTGHYLVWRSGCLFNFRVETGQ
ncbi:hypothetical protein B0T17DRAFT_136233 [Bombardia bombarda]|uniref:Uncharacterized protein n=1 Tax=Bombardia bombarda TaxID=252184 RepID=A0AA39TJE9_9PEZI|nr:hypothetical protein B0T17DRAFT_136233 [Bombardia bombarda]